MSSCIICNEQITNRPANARLCLACSRGHRPRTCERCGKPFRSVRTRICPACRRAIISAKAKAREAAKRQLRATQDVQGQAQTPPSSTVEDVLSPAAAAIAATLTHSGILAIRERLSMSQAEFGKAIGAGRNWPYSRAYISKLEAGDLPITDAIRTAVARLGSGTSHLKILPRACYATTDLPSGTVILGQPIVDPICGGVFIMPYANQKYCSKACRDEARRRRRQEHKCATT